MGKLSFLLIAVMLVVLTVSGCGKNVVGPSAPEVITPASAIQTAMPPLTQPESDPGTTESNNNVNASCKATVPGKKLKYNIHKHRAYVKRYVRKNIKHWLKRFYRHIRCSWYRFLPIKYAIKNMLLSNKLFTYIILRHRIDRIIGQKVMEIVSYAYAPGNGTNPGEFEHEVTLTPFKWHCWGFCGPLRTGWNVTLNATDGYEFQTKNAQNDLVFIDTKSYFVDIYKNNKDITVYNWNFFYDPVDALYTQIRFSMQHKESIEQVWLDLQLNELNSVQTIIDFETSTKNQSASYRIYTNDGNLNLDLDFDENGVGGGTLDILNKQGNIDHYEYYINADEHGYWTKNGGKKHYF